MNDKLGRKVTLREDSVLANKGVLNNRTGFIGIVCAVVNLGESPWYEVQWESHEYNFYEEEDLLWYDYVGDWKDAVRSWGGNVDE